MGLIRWHKADGLKGIMLKADIGKHKGTCGC